MSIEKQFEDGQKEELNATFVEFKKDGDKFTGILSSWDIITAQDGKQFKRYVLETDEGMISFLGGAQLDPILAQEKYLNRIVRVIYEGTEKLKGGRNLKKFKVLALKDQN